MVQKKMFYARWLIGSLLWIMVCWPLIAAQAQSSDKVLELKEGQEFWYIAPYSYYLEDREGSITIESLLAGEHQEEFKEHIGAVANFGFTGYAYWFRFTLQNLNVKQLEWLIGVENSLLDYVDLYIVDNEGEVYHRQTGDRRDFAFREIKHRFFYFTTTLPLQEQVTIYLRVQSEGSAEIPMVLKSPREFSAVNHEQQFGQGIFVGLLAVMIIYNICLGLGSRQVEYFLSAFFMGSLLIFKATMNGTSNEYLWPNWIWWANAASAFTTPLVFFSGALYAFKFLNIKDYPKLNIVYLAFLLVLGLASVSSFFLPYSFIKFSTIIGMFTCILLSGSSAYIYYKGFRPALFFIISFTLLIMGSMIYGFQKLGIINPSFFTVYCVEITSAMQAILLSIGQADKINEINKAIRKAQNEALEAQIETNRVTEMMKNKLEVLVEQRTADLWERNQEIRAMMDSLKQGLCTIDEDLRISGEYSKYLEQILGESELSDKSVRELIINRMEMDSDKTEQLATSIQSMVGESILNFEANEHVFPRAVTANMPNGKRSLELDWVPIENKDDNVSKVMLAIRDVTEIQQMKTEAANREHELKIIGQILKLNASKFQKFIQASFHLVESCRNIIQEGEAANKWETILRYIHTIKGNARTYGFEELAQVVHESEDVIFTFDRHHLTATELDKSLEILANIERSLEYYQYLNDVKLERSGFGATESALMEVGGLFKRLIKDGALKSYQFDSSVINIVQKVETLTSDTFRSAIRPVLDSLPSLAKQLGKKAPQITFQGIDFDIERKLAEKYEDIFVHLIRNSMDHGFQPHQQGEITIGVQSNEHHRLIIYSDSGRGINIRKLRQKGMEKGIIEANATDQQVAELVFHSGVSSSDKVTDISGRGVGMDAVKEFTAQLGGEIRVELLDTPVDPGFRLFRFFIELPIPKNESILEFAS